jgi:ParB family chromosome partitioning protein
MELIEIDIDSIVVKNRIREDLGDLTPLERSIKDLGLIFPILVNESNVLISGERRLAACKNIGETTVRALRVDVDENSMHALDIQSGENLCRKPLSNLELEKEIELKKSAMKLGKGGVIGSVKNLFKKS